MPLSTPDDHYSSRYRAMFFIFALIETLLCGGIIFGWVSVVAVFKEEKFYLDMCQSFFSSQNKKNEKLPVSFKLRNASIIGAGVQNVSDSTLRGCFKQDDRFNLILIISLICCCVINLPAGYFVDKKGSKIATIVGGVMYIPACVGLGFVSIGYENFLFPIFIFICMGGNLLFVAVYQATNAVYRGSGVICIIAGAFDSSAVVTLIFKSAKYLWNTIAVSFLGKFIAVCFELGKKMRSCLFQKHYALCNGVLLMYESGLSLQQIMMVYSTVCFGLISIGATVLIPPQVWGKEESEINQVHCVNRVMDNNDTTEDTDVEATENKEDEKEVLTASFNTSSSKQGSLSHSIFSPLYFLELVFLLTLQLKLWCFVGGLDKSLERLTLGNRRKVSEYVDWFGYIQLGGFLVSPVIGFVFEKSCLSSREEARLTKQKKHLQRLRQCILPSLITIMSCLLFCILSMIKDIRFQIPSFMTYTAVRGFLYAYHGVFIGAVFPKSQFATLYGTSIFISGIFGFLQHAFVKLTSGPLNGDPLWTNVILLILVSLGILHPFYLWWYVKREKKLIKDEIKS